MRGVEAAEMTLPVKAPEYLVIFAGLDLAHASGIHTPWGQSGKK
jgi:hypothetical protein